MFDIFKNFINPNFGFCLRYGYTNALRASRFCRWILGQKPRRNESLVDRSMSFFWESNPPFFRWVCLKIAYPYTQWLMIMIPIKNGYFIGGIPHFQTYPGDAVPWDVRSQRIRVQAAGYLGKLPISACSSHAWRWSVIDGSV